MIKARVNGEIIFLLLFKILLEFVYYYGVVPTSPVYTRLAYNPSIKKMLLSFILFFILCILLPDNPKKVSFYLVRIIFIFTIIPILSLYWQNNRDTKYVFWVAIGFIILELTCKMLSVKRILTIKWNRQISITDCLLCLVVLLIIALIFKYGLADFRALDIYKIYQVRAEHSYSGIWGYIVNWLTYALIPVIICKFNWEHKILKLVITIFLQIYLFLFSGSKTVLFSIALILISYFLVKYKLNFTLFWTGILSCVQLIAIFFYKFFDFPIFLAIFPTRLLNIPASINFNHYDFFSKNRKLYFSEMFIGRLFGVESPYKVPSTYLVSTGYGNANVGFWGDAYDNGGVIAMLLFAVILGIILCYFDALACQNKYPNAVIVGTLTYSMIYLNDGSLTSAVMTGGIWILLILFSVQEEKDIGKGE